MVKRCTQTQGLKVYHIHQTEHNRISNAKVLCALCHDNLIRKTSTLSADRDAAPEFTEFTTSLAMEIAGNQCECVCSNCHE